MLFLLVACVSSPTSNGAEDTADITAEDTGEVDRGESVYQFTFAIVADPHVTGETTIDETGIDVYITDATWDDDVTVRFVEVWRDEVGFTYVHHLELIE